MNTADRSIARIDTAMRRRFAFIELDPRIPPVHGLLRPLAGGASLPVDAALILDELNSRIADADADAAIGPSYLMDERVYQRDDGLDRVWQYSIMPLLEDLFSASVILKEHYGLASLPQDHRGGARRAVNPIELSELGPAIELQLTPEQAGRWPAPASSPRRHPPIAPGSGRSADREGRRGQDRGP